MKSLSLLLLSCLFLWTACDTGDTSSENGTAEDEVVYEELEEGNKNLGDNQANVQGLEIEGDFDGDGSQEMLIEGFVPQTFTENKQPKEGQCYVQSEARNIPRLELDGNCAGLQYLHNEGDLNGDGTDEISVVQDWESSFTRSLVVYSLENNQWAKLTEFTINYSMLEGDDPQMDYEELVQKNNNQNFVIMEYDAANPESMWSRKEVGFQANS